MSHNIDKIVYINLNKRPAKKELIENELNKFGLEYERFEAIETPGFGHLGCGYSHLAVLKNARDKGYKNILIFEDDFTFLVSKKEFESELLNFFEAYPNFDVCMLSYNLIKHEATMHDNILRVLNAQTTSGYIVNQNYYNKLIDLYEEALPILHSTRNLDYCNDQSWKKLQVKDNWYCLSKRIGKQKEGYSDTENQYVNYMC